MLSVFVHQDIDAAATKNDADQTNVIASMSYVRRRPSMAEGVWGKLELAILVLNNLMTRIEQPAATYPKNLGTCCARGLSLSSCNRIADAGKTRTGKCAGLLAQVATKQPHKFSESLARILSSGLHLTLA